MLLFIYLSFIFANYNFELTYLDKDYKIVNKKFNLIEILGQGAFGIVLKAESNGKIFAIKQIKTTYIDREDIEFENMRKINHENVLSCYGISYDLIDNISINNWINLLYYSKNNINSTDNKESEKKVVQANPPIEIDYQTAVFNNQLTTIQSDLLKSKTANLLNTNFNRKEISEVKEESGKNVFCRFFRFFANLFKNKIINKTDKVEPENIYTPKSLVKILIFEYMPSNLLEYYKSNSIKDRKSIFKQILLGLNEIQSKNLIHRDLKPDNILIDENEQVKIADLGSSIKCGSYTTNYRSAIAYKSPEGLIKPNLVGKKSDVWSVGILFLEICFGFVPIYGSNSQVFEISKFVEDVEITLKKWNVSAFTFPKPLGLRNAFGTHIKDDLLMDLIENMLKFDPSKRFTVENCLNHEYFN
ncbi:hypothetical protein NUSPORA_01849 [Nucleospora cyclopteri]